jgi:type VI protein secretion system component VasF
MLLDLVTRLQQLLEQQADPPQLATQWMAAENALHATDRRRRVRNVWIAVTIVFVFIAGLIGLGILAANKRW